MKIVKISIDKLKQNTKKIFKYSKRRVGKQTTTKHTEGTNNTNNKMADLNPKCQ